MITFLIVIGVFAAYMIIGSAAASVSARWLAQIHTAPNEVEWSYDGTTQWHPVGRYPRYQSLYKKTGRRRGEPALARRPFSRDLWLVRTLWPVYLWILLFRSLNAQLMDRYDPDVARRLNERIADLERELGIGDR